MSGTTGQQMLSLIKKPVGEVNMNYKLLDVAGLDSDTYNNIEVSSFHLCLQSFLTSSKKHVNKLVRQHLNIAATYSQQDHFALEGILIHVSLVVQNVCPFVHNIGKLSRPLSNALAHIARLVIKCSAFSKGINCSRSWQCILIDFLGGWLIIDLCNYVTRECLGEPSVTWVCKVLVLGWGSEAESKVSLQLYHISLQAHACHLQ
jgi:hypothetical protein